MPDPQAPDTTAQTPADPPESPATAGGNPLDSNDVYPLEIDGRRIVLVGTAHISQESVDLVRAVIEAEQPDRVCVELDRERHQALTEKKRWDSQDLRQVIRDGQLATLLINILLSSFQRRMGGQLGVIPGSELVEAVKVSESLGIPITLADRNIRITLRRAWGSIPWYRKLQLIASVLVGSVQSPELDEEELRRLRNRDVMSELMNELSRDMPNVKRVLIDERDGYLAEKIRRSEGERVVAVVGAGHCAGMCETLQSGREVDVLELEVIPPSSDAWKWIGWAIPAVIVGMLAAVGYTKGAAAAGDSLAFWILINAVPSALGCVIALAHPATIAAALLTAPFTSLTPVIGVGYVAALTQAWMRPPRVHEFQSVADDIVETKAWWNNRLLKVFLVFILSSFFGAIGTWVGGYEIANNLLN